MPFGAQQNLNPVGNSEGQKDGSNLLPLANLLQSIAQAGTLNNPRTAPQGIPPPNVVAAMSVPPMQIAPACSERNCNYRDYSQVPADESEVFFARTKIRDGDEPKGTNFPTKLHDMLSREEFADMISWSPHGRSWRVLKPKAFELQVLPKYFRHGKYNSFMRQVNGWGFRRISQGPDFNSYYHEFFLRGMPHLCRRMRRASANKGDGEVAYDPDFRTMRPLPPLDNSQSFVKSPNHVSDPGSDGKISTSGSVSPDVVQAPVPPQTMSCDVSKLRESIPPHSNGTALSQNPVLVALAQMLTNNKNQVRSTVPQALPAMPVQPQPGMVVSHNSSNAMAPNAAQLLAALHQRQQTLQQSSAPQLSTFPQQSLSPRLPAVQQAVPRQMHALPSNAVRGQNLVPPELILQAIACLSSQAQKGRGSP